MKKFPSGSGPPSTAREWKAGFTLCGSTLVGGYVIVSAVYDRILHPSRAGPNDLVCMVVVYALVWLYNKLHEWVLSEPPELLYPRKREPP